MADTLASLKDSVKNFDALNKKLDEAVFRGGGNRDDRFWYPDNDPAGNGGAIIRFLPAPPGEEAPFVRILSYNFKGPTGQYYSEKSLRTLGQTDPCAEYNSELFNSGIDENRKQASRQRLKLTLISNIYVVKDPLTPDNEGKVFLYRFGKQLWEKIHRASNPPDPNDPEIKEMLENGLLDEDEIRDPFNPFDPWEGANFRLKFHMSGEYRTYDDSKFLKEGPLFKEDKDFEEVWKQEHKLQPFLDPSLFKSYDELKTKLYTVLALNQGPAPEAQPSSVRDVEGPSLKESESLEGDDIDLDFLNEITEDDEVSKDEAPF